MYIDKLATQTGLPIYISEYDINIADDNQQKQVMQSQFTMFWNNPTSRHHDLGLHRRVRPGSANSGLMTSSGTSARR